MTGGTQAMKARIRTMLLNLSCPAVSQSCRRTRIPFTYIFLEMNSAPVVEVVFLGSNLFWVYRYNRLVLPTPEDKARELVPGHPPWQSEEVAMSSSRRTCVAHYYDLGIDALVIFGLQIRVVCQRLYHQPCRIKRRSQGVKGRSGREKMEGRGNDQAKLWAAVTRGADARSEGEVNYVSHVRPFREGGRKQRRIGTVARVGTQALVNATLVVCSIQGLQTNRHSSEGRVREERNTGLPRLGSQSVRYRSGPSPSHGACRRRLKDNHHRTPSLSTQ